MIDPVENIFNISVSQEIAPLDRMIGADIVQSSPHYFFVGRSNLYTIYNILNIRRGYSKDVPALETILDYGCGYGRVTRWLCAAFPDARISVTDLNMQAAEWCAKQFQCVRIDLAPPVAAFDLIWVGSVFTHLKAEVAEALLERLLAALKPNGVLAITTHGRPAIMRMEDFDWENDARDWMHFRLGRERFEQVAAGYRDCGYGLRRLPLPDGRPVRGCGGLVRAAGAPHATDHPDFVSGTGRHAPGCQRLHARQRQSGDLGTAIRAARLRAPPDTPAFRSAGRHERAARPSARIRANMLSVIYQKRRHARSVET